jgi:hypothetical protein
MAEPKISEVHLDLAQRILNIFSRDRADPFISTDESAKVLHPVLSPYRVEVRLPKHDKWFKEVDVNKDQRIDVKELAAYLT